MAIDGCMSFLSNPYVLFPFICMIFQIVVLALLIYGYWLYRSKAFQRHGKTMAWAVVLHLVFTFSIMLPSLVLAVIPEYIAVNAAIAVSIITLIHVPFGILALSLGTWFVISWRFRVLKSCFRRRRLMVLTMISWLFSLSLGIALYIIFYSTALLTGHF